MKRLISEFSIISWYIHTLPQTILSQKNRHISGEYGRRSVVGRCLFALIARINRAWTFRYSYRIYCAWSNNICLYYGEDIALETLSYAYGDTVTSTPLCHHESCRRLYAQPD